MRTSPTLDSAIRSRRVSRFAWRLEREWRALGLPSENQTVVVAVSGGPDSTALLLALHELSLAHRLDLKLIAAHLDHGLRGEAGRADADWVTRLANDRGISLFTDLADVSLDAQEKKDNLEQAARRVRYEFLGRVAAQSDAGYLVTGHTMDDQAETVLLRLLRGSGLEGLGGMRPQRSLTPESSLQLIRPFVRKFRRDEILDYCRRAGVEPRIDAMNSDPAFTRVAVRQTLIPVLSRFNPRIVETLVRTADLLSSDAAALKLATAAALAQAITDDPTQLSVRALNELSAGLRSRVIRAWLELNRRHLRRLELIHIRAIESLLSGNHGGRIVELPGGDRIERRTGYFCFHGQHQSD